MSLAPMRGAYIVAIALLVAAGSRSAAESDKDEVQQAHSNDPMASASTIDEMMHNRVLQGSRKVKDDLTVSAGDEERTPSALSSLLKRVKAPDLIATAANVMRTEGEASAIEAASENLNKLRSNERQQMSNNVVGEAMPTRPDSDISPVSIANYIRSGLAKRQTRERPTAIMAFPQHDYPLAPLDPSKVNAEALNGRLYKQLVYQEAATNQYFDGAEMSWKEDPFELLRLFEESAHPTPLNRPEASAIKAAPIHLIQLESKDRQRIASRPNNVVGQIVRPRSEPDKSPVPTTNDKPSGLAQRQKRKRPTAIMENAATFAKQDGYRPEHLAPSTINAEAFNGRLHKQPTTQKALELDKNGREDDVEYLADIGLVSVDRLLHLFEKFDEAAHPTTVNRQEASAIEAAPKKLNQFKSNTYQRIAPTPISGVGQGFHAPSDSDISPVLVGDDIPSVLAERLDTRHPTAIMNNAAKFLAKHDFRPALTGPSEVNVEAPNGRLNNQPITQKALLLDKNKHVDTVDTLRNENLLTVKHHLHLREGNDESAHFSARIRQNKPIDWTDDLALGPKPQRKVYITEEVKKVHLAFLEAFNLPFHQYLRETATMLNIVRWNHNSSPNNGAAISTLKRLTEKKDLEKLQKLLDSDLANLLGDGDTMLPVNLENVKEAFNVKLIIMFELFSKFCHGHKELVKGLPRETETKNWILKPIYYKQRQPQSLNYSSS